MTEPWKPKVGDIVRYISRSVISGALANVQAMTVTKVTKAGYVLVSGRKLDKFESSRDPRRFYEWAPKSHRGMLTYISWIEPISEEEAAELPRDNITGNRYARALPPEKRQELTARG